MNPTLNKTFLKIVRYFDPFTLGFTDDKGIYHVSKHELLREDEECFPYVISCPGKFTFHFTNIGTGKTKFRFLLISNRKVFKEETRSIPKDESYTIHFHLRPDQLPVECHVTLIKDEEKKLWNLVKHYTYEYSFQIHLISQTGLIKKWEKGDFIGGGSFGKVFKAIDCETGAQFAVKQVEIKSDDISQEKISVLRSEIDLLSKLDHPRIVKYLGSELTNDYLFIFLQYIPSGTLQSHRKSFVLNEKIVVNITRQLLEGLIYLHSQHIVHRDIKTSNILIDTHGNCYMVDFGSAKFLHEINVKKIEGTLNYMAPEFFKKEYSGKYTQACDIYSLGCVVYELMVGKAPFEEYLDSFPKQEQFLTWRMYNNSRLVIPTNLSHGCQDFLKKCLCEDPDQRFTAEKLLLHPWLTREIKIETKNPVAENLIEVKPESVPVGSFNDHGFSFDSISEPPPLVTYIFDSKGGNVHFGFH